MAEISWQYLSSLHDHFAKCAGKSCDAGEEVSPQVFIVGEEDASGPAAVVAVAPEVVSKFHESEEGKELLGEFLRGMFTEGHPLREGYAKATGHNPQVVIQVSEAWMTELSADSGKAASRTECLIISLHTAFGTHMVPHPILDQPTRHCSIKEFPAPDRLTSVKGRLTVDPQRAPPWESVH